MKKSFESLRKHAKNIINFENKKMLPLTKEELKSYQEAKGCRICRKIMLKKFANDKSYRNVRDHCHFTGKYRGAAHSICNLKFNVPNEIPVLFHNGSNVDYHFIIRELANKFEVQFECVGENTDKYKTFSFPIEKAVIKIDKDGNESVLLVEGIHKIKRKDCDCSLEYKSVKDNLIDNKDYSNKLDEKFKK